jgi:hypothetical protein
MVMGTTEHQSRWWRCFPREERRLKCANNGLQQWRNNVVNEPYARFATLHGQLVDATTGVHLWADRFEGQLEDIFDLQDRGYGQRCGSDRAKA